jgi:hypothetical protein
MIFIGGINQAEEDVGPLDLQKCKSCGQHAFQLLFVSKQMLSLFFVTIFSWGKKHFQVCPECGRKSDIPKHLEKESQQLVFLNQDYLSGNLNEQDYFIKSNQRS